MIKKIVSIVVLLGLMGGYGVSMAAEKDYWNDETPKQRAKRMEWWQDSRFGMFIHWGLYSVPAGEWGGKTSHAEWIRTTAKIPVETYDKFVGQFNPVKFDADTWVKLAKRAGMKYIVITTKHHDGFCLWPSAYTDFDIASTPYGKDILEPLTKACKKYGVRMCFYHSIMDWHNPDYLPRRKWEEKMRPAGNADYEKYVDYMKSQLKELVETYDPGVIWFDGEWESSWNHERGKDLYQYLRAMDHNLIINNRVDKGRGGMQGMSKDKQSRGDFGTPEQQIPAKGMPGVDWESCMTMNGCWGWNKADKRWKSSKDLIRKLADISSKGGNFLLNIGPKPDGTFPQEAIDRLNDIGDWMDVNSESIYETKAGPFDPLPWGRCTMKKMSFGKTRLYLHVFDWPADGKLSIPLSNDVKGARLLADPGKKLSVENEQFKLVISLPKDAPDAIDSVIALDIKGDPKVVTIDPYANETKAEHDARMAWWREAKFGMFIHWGVYAVPAGTYNGKQVRGIGEWIMNRGKIPVSEYRAYAKQFNPVKYDPDQWVRMAKDAGMKYIVITAKHHDGFALFDSKVDGWDVVDATPYKKDLLKPLVAAAKKQNMKIGFYYSQAQDWNHPGGAKSGYKEGKFWDPAQQGSFDDYLKNVAVPQVDEIMSNYDIDVFWWDTPTWMNRKRAEMLLPLLNKRPGIIHNNRLGGFRGDTDTPEQHIPATGIKGRDWETCMTMNGTWGYKSYDHNWKSSETLIHNLVDIVSKGGNYLLNVGPKPDGTFPEESIRILKDVGRWMKVNGESIYGTKASPCNQPSWGRITRKENGKNTTLYLHIFKWPKNGKIKVAVSNNVLSAELLADKGRKITTGQDGSGVTVKLSGDAPDAVCSVVKLEIKGKPFAMDDLVVQAADGSLMLTAGAADLKPAANGVLRIEEKDGIANIGYWINPESGVEWFIAVKVPGKFAIKMDAASVGDAKLTLTAYPQKGESVKTKISVAKSGKYSSFKTTAVGSIEIKEPGIYKLALRPNAESWNPVNLRKMTLEKQK